MESLCELVEVGFGLLVFDFLHLLLLALLLSFRGLLGLVFTPDSSLHHFVVDLVVIQVAVPLQNLVNK